MEMIAVGHNNRQRRPKDGLLSAKQVVGTTAGSVHSSTIPREKRKQTETSSQVKIARLLLIVRRSLLLLHAFESFIVLQNYSSLFLSRPDDIIDRSFSHWFFYLHYFLLKSSVPVSFQVGLEKRKKEKSKNM